MAEDNAYRVIAEIYRNREHTLINKLLEGTDLRTQDILNEHLVTTGRTPRTVQKVPAIKLVTEDIRTELLALLGPSEAERKAYLSPLAGLPKVRKQRSDKGKLRGPRKEMGSV